MTDAALVAAFDRLRAALGTAAALRVVARDFGNVGTGIRPEAHALLVDASARLGIPFTELRGTKRNRRLDRGRTICWWLLHRRPLELGPSEIAEIFDRAKSVVSLALDRFRDRLVSDDVLRATVASFDPAHNRREERRHAGS